ncbi:MAG: HTH domain-containing protein [Candidatus Kapaibacterium sp.]
MEIIRKNNKISATELAEILSVSDRTIERDLSKLKELNKIKRIGPAKGGYWQIISE